MVQQPEFIHQFCPCLDSENPLMHEGVNYETFEGFARHRAVERVLYLLRDWLDGFDGMFFYNFFQSCLSLLFGLNCRFTKKDIARYMVWEMHGAKPIAIFSSEGKRIK